MYSNLRKHFVSCVVQSCYEDKETHNSEQKIIIEEGEKAFQKGIFK